MVEIFSKINMFGPITIYEDNNGCISIASNSRNHKRSKHIDIKYHFTKEQVENKVIILKYIPKQLTNDKITSRAEVPGDESRNAHTIIFPLF